MPVLGVTEGCPGSIRPLRRSRSMTTARPHGVSVFAISPGTVKTDMSRVAFADVWDDPDFWQPPQLAGARIEYIGSGALDQSAGSTSAPRSTTGERWAKTDVTRQI